MPEDDDPASPDGLAAALRRLVRVAEQATGRKIARDVLARRIHVSPQSLYAYLDGTRLPPAVTLDALLHELGAPDDALRRLAQARDDVEELRRRRRPITTSTPVPRELPFDVRGFTGRESELRVLDALIDTADGKPAAIVISAIAGTAGVGKTALAIHFAHRVADRFPDGHLYVNLRGFDPSGTALTAGEALRGFLDALGVPPQRVPPAPPAQAGLYRSLLASRRMLIVLDNARDSEQVLPLLPGSPSSLVVVTSRNDLTGVIATTGAQPITLDLLTAEDATEMLARRLGRVRIAAEPHAVDDLAAACARLPLALAIVAARAAIHPEIDLATVAADLHDTRGRLAALSIGDPSIDVRAVFSWSYRALHPRTARLFRLLGLHPGPDLTVPAAASTAGITPDLARASIDELVSAHLLTRHAAGRYSFHDLLRSYTAELVATDDERHTARHRLLDHYLQTAHTGAQLLDPTRVPVPIAPPGSGVTPQAHTDATGAALWFTAETDVLLAILEDADNAESDEHIGPLAWAVGAFLDARGHWHSLDTVMRHALRATRRLDDRAGQAFAHRGIARAAVRLGHDGEACEHLRRAIDLCVDVGDETGQAQLLLNMCIPLEHLGDLTGALSHAQEALTVLRSLGSDIWEARALNAIGWYHAQLGDHALALHPCEQAVALLHKLGDRLGEAGSLDSLGYAHHHLGDHLLATDCFQRSHELYQQAGDRYGQAITLDHIGDSHAGTDDLTAARDRWQRALDTFEELGHPDAERVRAKLRRL